jgi:hypothetical protein
MKLLKIYGGYRNTSDVINSMARREEISSGENSHRKTKRSSSRLIIGSESLTRKDGSLNRKSMKLSDDH